MAGLLGTTQTIAGIGKSVSTVATGILKLEDNLATFIRKVRFYEKFYMRMQHNLPPEVVDTANRLFARCYEYREEIRDELESTLGYVADAGRWVVGMADWNSKMAKRLTQITELTQLANMLLMEYAMTGQWGAQGSQDELGVLLEAFRKTIVLNHPAPTLSERCATEEAMRLAGKEEQVWTKIQSTEPASNGESDSPRRQHAVAVEFEEEECLFGAPPAAVTMTVPEGIPEENGEEDQLFGVPHAMSDGSTEPETNDNDAANPFAEGYQTPSPDSVSLPFSQSENTSMGSSTRPTTGAPAINEAVGVILDGFEYLEMEAIPKFDAFKDAHKRFRDKLDRRSPNRSPQRNESPASSRNLTTSGNLTTSTPLAVNASAPPPNHARLVDLSYSIDLREEMAHNPFVAQEGVASQSVAKATMTVHTAPVFDPPIARIDRTKPSPVSSSDLSPVSVNASNSNASNDGGDHAIPPATPSAPVVNVNVSSSFDANINPSRTPPSASPPTTPLNEDLQQFEDAYEWQH